MSRSPYYAYHPSGYPYLHNHLGMSMANTPMPMRVISRPMPQQPMPPAPRRARQPKQLRSPDRRKRYGVVFNSDPLSGMLDDDDDSTWSMSRSRASRWMQNRQPTMRSRNSSPAQDIVARYRASQTSDDPTATAASSATYLQVPSVDGYYSSGTRSRTTSGETYLSSQSGPRLRYRASRAHAMDRATKEAYLMAVQSGGYRDIPCQRPGCRSILPTIRDLASHLAIHDLDHRQVYYSAPRYDSFMDMGHSVEGRTRQRYFRSSAPYARTERSYSAYTRLHGRVVRIILSVHRQTLQIPCEAYGPLCSLPS
ncbi:hypothetical protein C8Q80DRAFT_635494 [Daedaleopsis nitida]|nr:hypothetical protein C8Q80DRAFT_635494 [Daedaleopsis nitida]